MSCLLQRAMAAPTARQRQQGETLIGLLVGMGLSLVILAGGAQLLQRHLQAHRWALQDSHAHQDLRSAMAIMARELRQAQAIGLAWKNRSAVTCEDDFCTGLGDLRTQGQRIDFGRDRNFNGLRDNNECSGFRLKDHELQVRTACTPEVWTDLTDAYSIKLSGLNWHVQCELRGARVVRAVTVQLSAQWPRDPAKTLSLAQTIVLRNDAPAQPWPEACGPRP